MLKDIPPFTKGETWHAWRIATLDRVMRDARIEGEKRKRREEQPVQQTAVFGKKRAA